MRAGQLRHLIALQALVPGQDSVGQPVQAYSTVASVHADIRYPKGLESTLSNMPVGVTTASIRIRYRPGVVPTMRVLHGSTVFDIKAVLPDPTGRIYLDLSCESGANNG